MACVCKSLVWQHTYCPSYLASVEGDVEKILKTLKKNNSTSNTLWPCESEKHCNKMGLVVAQQLTRKLRWCLGLTNTPRIPLLEILLLQE